MLEDEPCYNEVSVNQTPKNFQYTIHPLFQYAEVLL